MLDDLSVPDPEEFEDRLAALARCVDVVAWTATRSPSAMTRFDDTLSCGNCSKYVRSPAFTPAPT